MKDGIVTEAVKIRWDGDTPVITTESGLELEVLSAHHDYTFRVRYQGETKTVFCHNPAFMDGTGDILMANVALSQHPHGAAAPGGDDHVA